MREKTILIVDDEKRMADSVCELLTGSGYHCEVAYSGREGIELLKRRTFKLLITDLRMQDIDGLDLIRFAKEYAPRTPIIVITGYASAESAIEAIHLHVYDYMRKPFDFDRLRLVVARAFEKLESDQLREDTTAMITHDIKIPLTSIIGFASMLYDRERKEFHPRAREFAEAIQANGQKILAMIENYLTTCKIETGTLQVVPSTVDLRQLMLDAVEATRIAAARRHREIELKFAEIPETIAVDEPLVFRAIGNILQNAIKYSGEGEPIHVRVRRAGEESPLEEESICIECVNLAPHGASCELEDIFQRYKRSHGNAGIEGTGLGLYVVQAIVRAHGGEATAEMLRGGFIRFAIYLPIQARD